MPSKNNNIENLHKIIASQAETIRIQAEMIKELKKYENEEETEPEATVQEVAKQSLETSNPAGMARRRLVA